MHLDSVRYGPDEIVQYTYARFMLCVEGSTHPLQSIQSFRKRLAAGSARGIDVGPAGEWLLDNFHVVQEHIQEEIKELKDAAKQGGSD